MLHSARFALLVGLSAAIPAAFALDPVPKQGQSKQDTKNDKKEAEPSKKEAPAADDHDERLDRRNSRMKERNREIDSLLNKKK